jgi:hypothetical protein
MKLLESAITMIGVASLCLSLAACGDGGGSCVECDDDATGSGIGSLVIGQGKDSDAKKCGFDKYRGHNGGVGDTLEVAGCKENGSYGVVLVWAYGEFDGYRVCSPGFKGTVNGNPLAPGQCVTNSLYIRD